MKCMFLFFKTTSNNTHKLKIPPRRATYAMKFMCFQISQNTQQNVIYCFVVSFSFSLLPYPPEHGRYYTHAPLPSPIYRAIHTLRIRVGGTNGASRYSIPGTPDTRNTRYQYDRIPIRGGSEGGRIKCNTTNHSTQWRGGRWGGSGSGLKFGDLNLEILKMF